MNASNGVAALRVVPAASGWIAIAVHAAAWTAGLVVIAQSLHAPPAQSAVDLAAGALALRAVDSGTRRWRVTAAAVVLSVFAIATVAVPLEYEFVGQGFMGDGLDFVQNRRKFEENIPFAGGDPAIHFKAHLGDMVLATADMAFGRNETSPERAYQVLSRLGGLLFLGELALVLVLLKGSRRACRFVALALTLPVVVGFFGYYEVGYLAVSIAAFPLLLHALRQRRQGATVETSAALQGVHAALHGFGLLGIAGGALAALGSSRDRLRTLLTYGAFATACYVGWVVIYEVLLKLSVESDPAAANVAIRQLTSSFYFDKRLVHPLTTFPAVAEIGMASLAVGVPLLAFGLWVAGRFERRIAALYALPGLAFLVLWWPSLGVSHDMDLQLGAFAGIGAGAWLAARTPRTAFTAWGLLVLVHVMFWAVIADRTMARIWIS
jgi:hypothetical protein